MTIREALANLIEAVEQFERVEGCANQKIAALAASIPNPLGFWFLFDEFPRWLEDASVQADLNTFGGDDDG